MMEVDMQSPPSTFRTMPFATIKRPRSPGSPSQERQTKRLSLAPVVEGHFLRRASTTTEGVPDVSRWIAGQDDWVRQARELSIASPLSVTAGYPPAMDEGGGTITQGRADEHMAIDDETSPTVRAQVSHSGSARPWTTRGHLPLIHIATTTGTGTPLSVLSEPPSSSSESASSVSSLPAAARTSVGTRACPPDIFLFPATPSDTPEPQHQFSAEEQGGQTVTLSQASLVRTEDRAEGSPRPSRTLEVPAGSLNKRHRVTMGPRLDCVKCRTGVRGHWMHFD